MTKDTAKFDTLYVTERSEWRNWLTLNHNSVKEIWLIYYKKHTGKKRIVYNDAVEEAICFGWIDTTVKRVDDEIYMQKFLPRKKNSKWSVINKRRAEKMMREGKIAPFGLEKINEAKNNGNWENAYRKKEKQEIPADLFDELSKNENALRNFLSFAPGYQNSYISWINDAKKEETRKRRIKKLVKRSSENIKPGLM